MLGLAAMAGRGGVGGKKIETLYFHGVPGAAVELELADRPFPPDWSVVDRAASRDCHTAAQHFDSIAERIRSGNANRPLRLVGFSLGAYAALEVANRLLDWKISLHLVSAAAPLQCGDFLPQMAGKTVFGLARRHPTAFALLSSLQAVIARSSPRLLQRALFASAQGADAELLGDPRFISVMTRIIERGLGHGSDTYKREVLGYVQDWSAVLDEIGHEVTLWHGDLDNWSPPAMATALAERLPNVVAVNRLPGHSHYSALLQYFGHSAH